MVAYSFLLLSFFFRFSSLIFRTFSIYVGWAGRKLRDRKDNTKTNYIDANQDKTGLALTAIWAIGITGLFWRIFQVQVLEK